MTTTIYDRYNKLVVTDTRWSIGPFPYDNKIHIVYVDDCEFEKIADREKSVMILAGDGRLIADWKRWWFGDMNPDNLPSTEIDGKNGIALIIINKVSNCVIYDCGIKMVYTCVNSGDIKAVFTGSGSKFAASNWEQNQCSKLAIEAAASNDPFTSNILKFVDFTNGKSNVTDTICDYQVIADSIVQGGYVMTLNEHQTMKLSESPLAEMIKNALAAGEMAASAPSPAIEDTEWTDSKKNMLREAIKEVRKLEGIE